MNRQDNIFIVSPCIDSAGFWDFFRILCEQLNERCGGVSVQLPAGMGLSQWPPTMECRQFRSISRLMESLVSEMHETVVIGVPMGAVLYGDEIMKPDHLVGGVYLLCLKSNYEDIAAVRQLIGKLAAHGVGREKILVTCLEDSARGALGLKGVEEEVGCRVTSVNLAKSASTARKGALYIAERLCRALSQDGTSEGEADVGMIEDKVSERIWKLMGRMELNTPSGIEELKNCIERELHAVILDKPAFNGSQEMVRAMHQKILDRIIGLGPIEVFLRDGEISEIMVNGPENIFVEKNGVIERTDEKYLSAAHLKVTIDRMVGDVGRRVDASSPLCDLRLKDGSRVNIVLPPLSLVGPLVTVRRFRHQIHSLEALVERGSVEPGQAEILKAAVAGRKNILIAGNSGSGKTTLLNILSAFINDRERIITMEDAAELNLQKSHVIRLETRPKNSEGSGEITMRDLVVNALRMRPDRLIVGECRGEEVVPMLQALNTGHDGSMATIHANSSIDAVKRIESLVLMAAPQWPIEVVREQIASAIHMIVFLSRVGESRTLGEIGEVEWSDEKIGVKRLG